MSLAPLYPRTRLRSRSLPLAAALSAALVGSLLPGLRADAAPAAATTAAVAAADTTITDTFDGTALDPRWQVVNPEPSALSVSGGALRLAGQPGDTYQAVNTAKNVVVLDIPSGDFSITTTVAASVAKVYQGAGLIAWSDMDNYVRYGLTYVGGLSPSGIALETDVETAAAFSAVGFADRPGSTSEQLRIQRVGNTLTTARWDAPTSAWVTTATTTVAFPITQVGVYSLAAQDGTVTPAAFDSVTVTHAEGADQTPSGSFALSARGTRPFLVSGEDDALALTDVQPTSSLVLTAASLGDGLVGIRRGTAALVVDDDGARLVPGGTPTPVRLTDAGGGTLVVRTEDGTQALVAGADGALAPGALADAARFTLTPVTQSQASLTIDGDGTGAQISDTQFGIFYEDINYAADGGLYAELVRNRSFEFNTSDNSGFTGLTGWQAVSRSGAGTTGTTVVNDASRLNDMNRNYLRLVAPGAGDGIRNTSYNNGIAVQAGKTYTASVWARTTTAQTLALRVEDNAGTGTAAAGTLAVDGSNTWKRYAVTLTATATTDAGRFAVLAGAPSTVLLDMVSLMPTDTWVGAVNGPSVFRKDLADKIAAMKPSFLRFPGGCVTNVGTFRSYEESGYTDRRRTYQWKETLGPIESRPTNWNFWGYNQTYGIGYLEYFEFAEDLGAEPLPVVSVGANGCGSTIPEMTDPAQINRWVQDTVDLIEFANGDTTTTWGARRAALGHPEPFGLKWIGLGNEENTTTFEANFPKFRDAIKARYPEIQIISNSGPDSSGARFDTLWNFNRQQQVDLVDEHYYRDPSWFLANNHRYDSYDRNGPKVFLGEYASRGNTLANALSEASYMTALQRNADVVQLASYAPLLSNESYVQWNPDAIWYDNDESYESVNWHVQKMFGNNVGDEVVPSTFDGSVNDPADIKGGVFLSTWNTSAAYDNVKVTANGTGSTLFEDTFSNASQWQSQTGSWAVNGGRYVQSSTTTTDARSIVTGAYTKDWSNYTLELDATKLSGAEGFLVGFAAGSPNSYYWWNLGGWGNTRSVLQRAQGGSAAEVKALENKVLATGQTYKVKVVVAGTSIKLYLDGVLQMEYDQADASEQVFQVVTRDDATGDLVAKVVNTSNQQVSTHVEVSDVGVEPTGTLTTLSGSPTVSNTKAAPRALEPVTRSISGLSESFDLDLAPYSVSFLRMHTTDSVAPVVSEVEVTGTSARGWYADPATVRVAATDDRGVDHLEVSVDDGGWQTVAGSSGSVQVTGDGVHTVRVRAVDAAGNVGEIRPTTVSVDAEAPVSQADLDEVARTVTLRAADSGSGVSRLEYRLDTGAWSAYAGPVQLGPEATTVGFRAVDALGNAEVAGTLDVPAGSGTRAATTTTATATPKAFPWGGSTTVEVRVAGGATAPTGNLTLQRVDGQVVTVIDRTRLAGGTASFVVDSSDLAVGQHTLRAVYAGDATHRGSLGRLTVTVRKAPSTTTASVTPSRVTTRDNATVDVSVDASTAGTAVDGVARVKVTRGSTTVLTRQVPLSNGAGSVQLPRLAAGGYQVQVTFTATATVATSTTTLPLQVSAP